MKNESGTDVKPPYVAYKTFSNLIKSLRESGLPNRLDRSVLPGLSGAAQSFVLSAFRFFGFTGEDGGPTAVLKDIIDNPKNEKAILAKAVKDKYNFVFDGKFNILSATEAELLEKFKERGLSGSTVRKCLSFFTMICEAADIPLSPHIAKKGSNGGAPGTKRKYTRRKQAASAENSAGTPMPPPGGTIQERFLEKFPAFNPAWPQEFQDKWLASFDKIYSKLSNQNAGDHAEKDKPQ